jgi:hypothetical protein
MQESSAEHCERFSDFDLSNDAVKTAGELTETINFVASSS